MQGFTSGVNLDVVQTELDRLFFQVFEEQPGPNMTNALDSMVFRQDSADNNAVITELMMGTGFWQERSELEDVNQDLGRVAQKQTFTVAEWANSLDIPKRTFDDQQFSAVNKQIEHFARMARVTRDNEAFLVYRDAFAGATFNTNDGVSLVNNAHTNINGDTVDNLETAALSDTSLETMIVSLIEQVNQRGIIMGFEGRTLLVPPELFKEAIEVTESELRSGSADNDLNVFSAKYNMTVKQSNRIGAAAGGSDTSFFLLADLHNVYRWEREGINTDLMDWKLTRNNVYVYKGHYREQYGAASYEGIVGNNGTT